MNQNTQPTLGFPQGQTVLLVINPVNDFLDSAGAAWPLTKATVQGGNLLDKLAAVIAGARSKGAAVVFAPMAFTQEDYAQKGLQRRSAFQRFLFERKICQAGTWGADFHPSLRPMEGETILRPHKTADVMRTDLPDVIGRQGATHLVICGLTAAECLATGLHAVEEGYEVTFLSDAIGAESQAGYDAAIHQEMPFVGGGLMKVGDFLNIVGSEDGLDMIAKGDQVYSSDNEDLGKIEELVMDGEEGGYLKVSGGLLGQTFYAPMDAVYRRMGPHVYINVPKSMVGNLGWDAAPTRSGQSAKFGLPAEHVKMPYRTYSPTGASLI